MKVFRTSLFWIWLIVSVMVAWAIHNQTIGMSALVVIIYGICMVFLGFVMSMHHYQERENVTNEARKKLQVQYQYALVKQMLNMRKALMYLTNRALSRAAGKLIAELLPRFDNEEQFDAAVERSKVIVEEEMDELRNVLGGIHAEDEKKSEDS